MEIQKKPYEWMVKFTPQREWIERRGLLLWLAFFCGVGGGLYLVSLYFNSLWGMFIGWLIVVFGKGGFHLSYLGKPSRFWRAFLRPRTSWLSRGLIFVAFFASTGAIQMALTYWLSGTAIEIVFKVLAGMAAFLVAIYTGFLMGYVRAIPFWNSSLLPVLFIGFATLGGCGIALAIGLTWDTSMEAAKLEWAVRLLLTSLAIMLAIYLWTATYTASGGKDSVLMLLRGPRHFSLPFWIGLIAVGIIIPLLVVWYSYAIEVTSSLLFVGIISEFIGGLALRYSLLRGGGYRPLIPL